MQKLVLSGYRLVSTVDINVRQSTREIKNTQARDIDNIGHSTTTNKHHIQKSKKINNTDPIKIGDEPSPRRVMSSCFL